ncbi:MAG: hypothetical protein J2P24_17145, partial [Streptosporangiales bacterium]|nr:hypothetical protein [Streptosporangiales bacterium]
LEPGFTEDPGYDAPLTVARLRFPGVEPEIDAAVDAALDAAAVKATDVEIPEWAEWCGAADDIMLAEGYPAHRHLLARADRLEERHVRGIRKGAELPAAHVVACRRVAVAAKARLRDLLAAYGALALPTLRMTPPRIGERAATTYLTVPMNLTGLPAVSLPVPRRDGGFPASLQLVGGWYAEESLLALAAHVEAAVR